MNFVPVNGHILIEPEEITNAAKVVKRDDGSTATILQGDRSKDLAKKAVNKGKVVATSSNDPNYVVGSNLVYYPFCPNKILMEDKEYDVIHERDVMGYVKAGQVE